MRRDAMRVSFFRWLVSYIGIFKNTFRSFNAELSMFLNSEILKKLSRLFQQSNYRKRQKYKG